MEEGSEKPHAEYPPKNDPLFTTNTLLMLSFYSLERSTRRSNHLHNTPLPPTASSLKIPPSRGTLATASLSHLIIFHLTHIIVQSFIK